MAPLTRAVIVAAGFLTTTALGASARQAPSPRNVSAPAAQVAPGSGVIFGQTVEADTSKPVGGTIVTLLGTGIGPPRRLLADAEGHFVFRDLPKGTFSLTATKSG